MKHINFWKLSLAVLIGVVMVIGLFGNWQSMEEVVAAPQALSVRPHVPYLVHYRANETVTPTWGILIDLSDSTNYPHIHDNRIVLKSLQVNGYLDTASQWQLSLGVVTAVTTATTSVEWIHENIRATATQFDYDWTLPEHGLNLMVSGGTLPFVFTNEITSTAAITSGTVITTTTSVTTTPGVGDLIGFVDEIHGSGTITVSVDIAYDTE